MMTVDISPSQVKTFRDCRRKWGWTRIDKVPKPPPSAAQKFGTKGHEHAENYLVQGTTPPKTPEGKAFAQAITRKDFLPVPSPNLVIERELGIHPPEVPGVRYWGYADCIIPPGEDSPPIVIDHKFTKDRKWTMTHDQLAVCPQALLYAVAAMLQYETDRAWVRWLYYIASGAKTRKPKGTKKVELLFTPDSIAGPWADLMEDLRTIRDIRLDSELTTAKQLKPSWTACEMFGGCEFKHLCNDRTKSSKLAARLAQAKKSGVST